LKIELEVKQSDFERLSEIARKVGVSVVQLCQKELDDALTSGICWLERGEL
jgi:hypothetical protein